MTKASLMPLFRLSVAERQQYKRKATNSHRDVPLFCDNPSFCDLPSASRGGFLCRSSLVDPCRAHQARVFARDRSGLLSRDWRRESSAFANGRMKNAIMSRLLTAICPSEINRLSTSQAVKGAKTTANIKLNQISKPMIGLISPHRLSQAFL